MALRDLLAGEDNDNRAAAEAAASGRSITGLSGRHTEIDRRFASGDEVFGGQTQPVAGECVARPQVQRVAPDGLDALIGDDPIFRQQRPEQIERKPFGDREQTLAYPARPGYRRYWFNDRAGRINRAKQAGYAHVIDPDTSEPLQRNTDVIDGRGRSSYLMEIPMEWYQQDMAKNASTLAKRLNDIKSGRAGQDVTVEKSYSDIKITGR